MYLEIVNWRDDGNSLVGGMIWEFHFYADCCRDIKYCTVKLMSSVRNLPVEALDLF